MSQASPHPQVITFEAVAQPGSRADIWGLLGPDQDQGERCEGCRWLKLRAPKPLSVCTL